MKLNLVFLFIILLFSCDSDTIPAGAFVFEDKRWPDDLIVPFEFEMSDTSNTYDFVLILRNTTDYKYSNLFVGIEEFKPYGSSVTQRHEIPIAYPDGSWIGDKSGSIIENKYLIKRSRVPYIGKYKFEIKHLITDKEVEEVLDLSMMVHKYDGN